MARVTAHISSSDQFDAEDETLTIGQGEVLTQGCGGGAEIGLISAIYDRLAAFAVERFL